MYRQLQRRLIEHLRDFLRRKYRVELQNVDLLNIVVEQPPKPEMGEYALPLCFELAKRLRKAPRKIAEEIVAELAPPKGFARFEVAGAGYINARIERAPAARQIVSGAEAAVPPPHPGKILVEHTSINPNKAAHIGHLRNAILGDTFVRLLRAAGRAVDVQNYIDNTGVQVADVVVGLTELEHKQSAAEVRQLIEGCGRAGETSIDYYCWNLYARVSEWYGLDKGNLKARLDTLHAIEQGGNEMAEIAAEQAELPQVIGNVLADVADRAIGAHYHLGILVRLLSPRFAACKLALDLPFGNSVPGYIQERLAIVRPGHHPAALVLALGLVVEHAFFLEMLECPVPEMQAQDLAFPGQEIIFDV